MSDWRVEFVKRIRLMAYSKAFYAFYAHKQRLKSKNNFINKSKNFRMDRRRESRSSTKSIRSSREFSRQSSKSARSSSGSQYGMVFNFIIKAWVPVFKLLVNLFTVVVEWLENWHYLKPYRWFGLFIFKSTQPRPLVMH